MLKQGRHPNVVVLPSRCSHLFSDYARQLRGCVSEDASHAHDGLETKDRADRLSVDQKRMLDSMLRVDVVAQQARAAFSSGRSCLAGKRPDLRCQEEMDCEKVEQARELMSKYNVRPSLGGPIVSTSFGVLGLLSNVLPRAAASAVEAGFEDAFVETFNEHLRNVRESGFAEKAVEVRQLIRELRDRESYAFREDRQGFHLKSLLEILQSQSVTPMEGIAALSKSATKLMLGVVKHV